jgi:MCP family monocarboxylic acid transporter-like MFS transporter 10
MNNPGTEFVRNHTNESKNSMAFVQPTMAGLERAQNDFGPADNVLGTPSYQSSTVDHYSRQEANQSARFSPADEKQAQLQLGVDDFPDGGLQAWLVVVGTTCGTFSTFGFIASWGVFQAYYEEVLMPTRSASDIAWIGSLQNLILISST